MRGVADCAEVCLGLSWTTISRRLSDLCDEITSDKLVGFSLQRRIAYLSPCPRRTSRSLPAMATEVTPETPPSAPSFTLEQLVDRGVDLTQPPFGTSAASGDGENGASGYAGEILEHLRGRVVFSGYQGRFCLQGCRARGLSVGARPACWLGQWAVVPRRGCS